MRAAKNDSRNFASIFEAFLIVRKTKGESHTVFMISLQAQLGMKYIL